MVPLALGAWPADAPPAPCAHTAYAWQVLVVHGGLFSKTETSLDDLRQINRHQEPPGLLCLIHSLLAPLPSAFAQRLLAASPGCGDSLQAACAALLPRRCVVCVAPAVSCAPSPSCSSPRSLCVCVFVSVCLSVSESVRVHLCPDSAMERRGARPKYPQMLPSTSPSRSCLFPSKLWRRGGKRGRDTSGERLWMCDETRWSSWRLWRAHQATTLANAAVYHLCSHWCTCSPGQGAGP